MSHAFDQFGQYFNLICDALRDYVPFAQFKKREKRSWRSVTFSKEAYVGSNQTIFIELFL